MMLENSNDSQQDSAPNGDGQQEGSANRRRRRRGKRRPDDRGTTDAPQSSQEGTTPDASTSRPPQQPRREQQPRAEGPRQGEGESTSEGGEGSERRRRNNRRKKKGPRPVEGETATQPTDEGAPSTSETPDAAQPQPQRQQERRREGGREGGRDGGRNRREPQEKKERAPRGSVLQRRNTRPGVDLDAALAAEPVEVAPVVIATDVDQYIKNLKGWQREVVTTLRGIIRNHAREAEEAILWSQPVYTLNGPVCYIKAFTDHVNLGFWRGNEVDDPEDLLTGELPTMRHVSIRSVNDVNREAFEAMVRSAVKLNKEKGDPT